MSRNETTASCGHRRLAVGAGATLLAGFLFFGGLMAYAAATTPADPQIVSVSWSGPDGQTVGATTTTIPQTDPAVDAPVTSDESGGSVQQAMVVAVLPGPLTVAPTAESVPLAEVRPFGRGEPDYVGAVPSITVDDARGSLVGWRATVSLEAVSGLDTAQLARARLCVSPHPTTLVAGNPADIVRSSPRSCAGPGDPIAVFFAAPGGGGGTYSDIAAAVLVLPNGAAAQNLTASLAVAVR